MKRAASRSTRHRGISRIDQPSTRTFGWFVRTGFYKQRAGTYVPRHRKFFGDLSHGGKRRALQAAQRYLASVERAPKRKVRRARRAA
ncbi:MAG TPA: hypothetical protein VFD76_06430 [Gemmatimonadales bacterium]|jgi:hypothetical protein|nr:hypothetical protein [Gemmatimonadales bacterium]